jgi:cytochrome c5
MYDTASTSSNDRPTVEEAYSTASNTSDLTVVADHGGAGDILIAAGWSPQRLGAALLRLVSEWDRAEKPPKPTAATIQGLVGTFQRPLPGEPVPAKPVRLTSATAPRHASAWYLHDMGMLCGRMAHLPVVVEQVGLQAHRWSMGRQPEAAAQRRTDAEMLRRLTEAVKAAGDDETAAARATATLQVQHLEVAARDRVRDQDDLRRATVIAGEVVRYWLDQTCRACHGTQWEVVPGTGRHSGKACKGCGGSGTGPIPHGQDGRKLLNHMDDCLQRGRDSIRTRLRSLRT